MSGFAPSWLDARERVDHRARSRRLAGAFAAAVGAAPRIVDLGAGSGSNLRYLAPLLPAGQRWELVDHDPLLLEAAATRLAGWAAGRALDATTTGDGLVLAGGGRRIDVALRRRDIRDPERAASGPVTGITAAALLDLTSAAWLDGLAAWLVRGPLPLLAALSFDGRLAFAPALAEDETVRRLFVRHQQTDKGFGPALGPEAARHLADRLAAAGRRVEMAASDWHLDDRERELVGMFLDGVGGVLQGLDAASDLASWMALRRQQLSAGQLRITVGHQDLIAV